MNTDPSREELFALVWERPATEVARELGISDVALGKLCRRLQVLKPPRGYWARVASGKAPICRSRHVGLGSRLVSEADLFAQRLRKSQDRVVCFIP